LAPRNTFPTTEARYGREWREGARGRSCEPLHLPSFTYGMPNNNFEERLVQNGLKENEWNDLINSSVSVILVPLELDICAGFSIDKIAIGLALWQSFISN
tara:strand:+ start:428 stop:727 length:300 start_codon:yes stop_codon:yes gene_type:complete